MPHHRSKSSSSTEGTKKLKVSKIYGAFMKLPDVMVKEVFNRVPLKEKAAWAHTSVRFKGLFSQHIHAAKCLMLVAHGEEDAVAEMLAAKPSLLLEPADVTDYSGRRFKNITPYEYAYWAKDWHMCRKLKSYMDPATKAQMLRRVEVMERDGLNYEQYGGCENSKHFDFTALIRAYTNFLEVEPAGAAAEDLDAAWLLIGQEQRDVPAFVAQEFCRIDRLFSPIPRFDELSLPRKLTFYNEKTMRNGSWFPIADGSGMGTDFTIFRAICIFGASAPRLFSDWLPHEFNIDWRHSNAVVDLAAVEALDAKSTLELKQSRDNLKPLELVPALGVL